MSVKIAMFIYLFPLPTGKCLMDDAQDLNGAFKVHYLHLPHSLVSLAKIKEKLKPSPDNKKEETKNSVIRSENKHEAGEKGISFSKAELREGLLTAAQVTAPISF